MLQTEKKVQRLNNCLRITELISLRMRIQTQAWMTAEPSSFQASTLSPVDPDHQMSAWKG